MVVNGYGPVIDTGAVVVVVNGGNDFHCYMSDAHAL